jgi:hypothetical protein
MFPNAEDITVSEVESIIGLSVKSLEGCDQVTRRAHAHLVGHILSLTQTEVAVTLELPKSKKENGKEGDDADEVDTPTQLESTKKALLTPKDMLAQLSIHFNKTQTSRKSRIGMFDFYVSVFNNLGSTFVESNYGLVVHHFLHDIASHSRNNTTRHDRMLVRMLIGVVLRDLIGVRMLSEQGQISGIQELSNSCLKRWPAMMPGQTAPSPSTLVIALKEVSELLQQLGNSPPPVQVSFIVQFPS